MADENLLPKPGTETSSFYVALIMALSPVALAALLIVVAAFTPYREVRDILLEHLDDVILGLLGSAGTAMLYIYGRSKVSVAKMEAYSAIKAAPLTTQGTGTQINVTTPTE